MSLVWSSVSQTAFTEYTATGTFNDDDVRALYIDWGDGQDPDGNFTQDLKYANYQWVKFTEPKKTVEIKHTYTSTGTFNPVVQSVNSEGFVSHYYSAGASGSSSPLPYTVDATVTGATVSDGQATGVMRAENKTVLSGIDNSIFEWEGPKPIYLFIPPLLTETELGYFEPLKVDIECEVIDSGRDRGSSDSVIGGSARLTTLNVVVSGTDLTQGSGFIDIFASGANGSVLLTGATCSRILKVTYKNPKYVVAQQSATQYYTQNAAYNKMKVFVAAFSNALSGSFGAATNAYRPICYVTPGMPVKKAEDKTRNVVLDFSQSRAKAANVSLKNYRYDGGKMWYDWWNTWGITGTNFFTDTTKTTDQTKTLAYTYQVGPLGLNSAADADAQAFSNSVAWRKGTAKNGQIDQYLMDDFGRFTDVYHYTRVQVEPSSATNGVDTEVSSIIDNKIDVYRITPFVTAPSGGATGYRTYPTVLTNAEGGNLSATYTTAAFANSYGTGSNTIVNLAGMNTSAFKDFLNASREAKEYLLLLMPKKTNNVMFNIDTYANHLMSVAMEGTHPDGAKPAWNIAGLYYLAGEKTGTVHQNFKWKPLEFSDSTALEKEYRNTGSASEGGSAYTTIKASLSKSGPLTFDMPLDWTATTLSGMTGGTFSRVESSLSLGESDVVEVQLTGTVNTTNTPVSGYGKSFKVSGANISSDMTTAGFVHGADVGSYKYAFIPKTTDTGADDMNRMYWVASGAADAWDADDSIHLQYGDTDDLPALTNGSVITGSLRRINVYDAIDGFSKVYNVGTSGSAAALQLTPVGANENPSTNYFDVMDSTASSGCGYDISGAWGTTEMFALKLILNGTTGSSADGPTGIYPTINNIFDGNRGYSEIIREIDDSGYNLNSLPITSDIQTTRAGTYYSAITRKGKVFIQRTGTPMQTLNLSSIGTGDTSSSTSFTSASGSSLYGHLHMMRRLQAEAVDVYWDEPQKDGTFVRFFGLVTSISETHGGAGPRSIIRYSASMIIKGIALIDGHGIIRTDIHPIGGLIDERDYT
mgnify:CR=1 FL=1